MSSEAVRGIIVYRYGHCKHYYTQQCILLHCYGFVRALLRFIFGVIIWAFLSDICIAVLLHGRAVKGMGRKGGLVLETELQKTNVEQVIQYNRVGSGIILEWCG